MGRVRELIELSQSLQAAGRFADAVGPAQDAVTTCEALAGSPDYSRLGDFTPNDHWPYPNLVHALANLATAQQQAGDHVSAVTTMEHRVAVFRRLGGQPDLGIGLTELSDFLLAAGRALDAVPPAEEAVAVDETLAGAAPNAYWSHPYLANAQRALGYAYRTVGRDLEALAVIDQRVKTLERIGTGADHAAWTAAHEEQKVFWRNAGMPTGATPQAPVDYPQQRVAGPVTALSRNPNQIDVFGVGHDGWVHSNWWTANTWHEWFRIADMTFPPQTPVAALSRDDDFMDIFAVGRDLGVHTSWWNGNPWRPWYRVGTRAFPERTPIATLSRNTNQMDLFAVAADGLVHNAWWNGNPWRDWAPIGTLKFPERTPIAAVSRNANQMDLFAVGPDNRVYNAWWNGNWSDWVPIGTQKFPHRTPIAAICRNSDQMDIFAVGDDYKMHCVWWNGQWAQWFPIEGQTFAHRTPVAALTRDSDFMDIFAVAEDGRVHTSWWNGSPWSTWFPMSERRFAPDTVISAVARTSDHMDLFATGLDGRVCFAKWNGNPWLGWFPISVLPRRPFYIVAHNPNSLGDAHKALREGANALGPDINVRFWGGDMRLVMAHDLAGAETPPPFEDYLDGLHAMAQEFPHFALVIFDIKPAAALPEFGLEIMTQVRQRLTYDTKLNVVYSVGKIAHAAAFKKIVKLLGPREGLMIDEENDPSGVINHFNMLPVANQGYGNGISVINRLTGPYYRKSLEAACTFRAQLGQPRFIVSWTNNSKQSMRDCIDIGVDGIITDDIGDLQAVLNEAGPLGHIRLAARADNPFQPDNRAFGLTIDTSDKWGAGTDANVTFTLVGTEDMATKTIDAGLVRRLESGGWDYVTIPSLDIGTLTSIVVRRDDTGIAPDWHLNRIDIASERYRTHRIAIFNRWFNNTDQQEIGF